MLKMGQTEPKVYSLLPLYRHIVLRAVRKANPFDPVAELPGGHINPCTTHFRQTPVPVSVPHGRPLGIRHSRVELHVDGGPSLCCADGRRELDRVVVRMMVAESALGVPEKFLAIEERDSALFLRLFWHRPLPENNPAGAFRRVRRGTIAIQNIGSRDRSSIQYPSLASLPSQVR